MSQTRTTGRGSQISIIASNLLPAFGVLALGWPAAPAVFLLWLDSWLGILAGRGILWAVALATALRALQTARVMRSESLEPFRAAAPNSYMLLVCRCCIMYGLAFLMRGLGRFGLGPFHSDGSSVYR